MHGIAVMLPIMDVTAIRLGAVRQMVFVFFLKSG